MIIETIKALFTRDLKRLREEIESYSNENNLWRVEKNITNSAGNLCLHLIGNLNTYIGKEIGKTGYIRNREHEFSLKNIPRGDLLQKIEETIIMVNSSLNKLAPEALEEDYPEIVLDKATSI